MTLVASGVFCLHAATAHQPVEMTVRAWRPEDGLPDRTVTAVLQTRDGYLWVGTPKGLVRFDGVQFQPVHASGLGDGQTLAVTVLCEDRRGRLWVGTQGSGLWHRNGRDFVETPLPVPLGTSIHTVTSTEDGTLWVGTSAGLVEWREGKARRLTVADGLPHDTISQVSLARNGDLWITTAGGICQWRGGQIRPVRFEAESTGRSPEFLGVYEDRQGNLWAFGDTYLVNLTEGKRVNYFRSGDVTSVRIWTLWEGRDGRLWIGTSGQGLFYFAGERFLPLTLRSGTLPNDVRALCEDARGNLWLGTGNSGLVCLRPTRIWLHGAETGLPAGPVTLVATNASGQVWVGVQDHGLWQRTADGFQSPAGWWRASVRRLVRAIAFGGPDRLWISTAGAGLFEVRPTGAVRYTTADGLVSDDIALIAVADNGALWVAPRSGGLQLWRPGSRDQALTGGPDVEERVTALFVDGQEVWVGTEKGRIWHGTKSGWVQVDVGSPKTHGAIWSFHRDVAGRLWVGTHRGLGCWTAGRWQAQIWTEESFAPVRGLLLDVQGRLWWTTGSSVYSLSAGQLRLLRQEGRAVRPRRWYASARRSETDIPWGWPHSAVTPDGQIWFATESGLVSVRPEEGTEDRSAPPVWIESLLVNGERWHPSDKGEPLSETWAQRTIRLPAGLRSLVIEFSAPLPSEGEKIRFQHRLEGFDPDWMDDGTERRIRYGRLPGGLYRLQLRARSVDDDWESAVTELSIVVATPFWRSFWGWLLWACLLTGSVAGLVRWTSHRRWRRQLEHLAQQEAMHKERMRIARDMHDELGSKLTRISFLSERAMLEMEGCEPVAGKLQAIAHTSRTLLQALDEIVWAVNPSNDSLEHLVSYLAQYTSEYFQATSVECQLRLPRQVPNVPLSAEVRHEVFLACEEALNNVLKHAQATKVLLEMHAADGVFFIRIQDDGRGFAHAAAAGLGQDGLGNMRRRMAEIGGDCRIKSQPGCGTVVELSFPLPTQHS